MSLLRPLPVLAVFVAPLSVSAVVVTGTVVDRLGSPIEGATVVDESQWISASSDKAGVFHLDTAVLPAPLRVTAPSGESVTCLVQEDSAEGIRVQLPIYVREALELDAMVVLPSRFPVGDMPGAQMKSTEALLTPGALAEISRALQTLPGVDAQDEGDALYVRGGDAFETGVFVNGARYEQVRNEENPIGTFVGSVSPFIAESIRFEAGGFGAGRGNILSAVVEVETLGAPTTRAGTLNVGVGAISAGLDLPMGRRSGLRLTATRRDTAPIFRLNGASRSFVEEPNGHDISLLHAYSPNVYNTVRLFAVEQQDEMAVEVRHNGRDDVYAKNTKRRQGWASWDHDAGAWQGRLDLSWSEMTQAEGLSLWDWSDRTQGLQAFGRFSRRVGERARVAGGFELDQHTAHLAERYEQWRQSDEVTGERGALWGEVDWMVADSWRAVTGWRADYSNRGGGLTSDPRLALGHRLVKGLDLSASWGVYHQRPDLVALSTLRGDGDEASQRATHTIIALNWQSAAWQARLEAYEKVYRNLVLVDSERRVFVGEGRAKGVELSGRFPLPAKWKGRLSMGVSDAARSEPRSRHVAPYGVPFSSALIVQREFEDGWQLGLTWRQASGRKYTPVVSGILDATTGQWAPVYGSPNSASLRPLQRLDLLLTRIRDLNTNVTLVTYLSVSNVLGRSNLYEMNDGSDYREQQPVRSILNRIIYVGCSFNFR